MSWLVKRRHYDGGESVVGSADSKTEAAWMADERNTAHQSATYYVEEYDPAKVEWPEMDDALYARLAKGLD